MQAAIYHEFQGPISIEQVNDPSPPDHGVIIEVKATGLCRSDWHGWMGHDPDIVLPHIPGHELAGIIIEKGKSVTSFNIGDRVTVPFVCGCGDCPQCDSGNQQICDHQTQPGFTHWGSFAERVRINQADLNLVKIPEDMTFETAATLGCRFITSFRAVADQGKVKQGDYVAVFGCGGVGLSAIMIANALNAYVIGVDINDSSLQLAKRVGASEVINVNTSTHVVDQIQSISKGGVHVSLDALGSQQTCFDSISSLRKRGKHIQVGLMAGIDHNPRIPINLVIARELEILGSHGMQAHRYPQMLRMIEEGLLKPSILIEKIVSLKDIPVLLPEMNTFSNPGVIVINSF